MAEEDNFDLGDDDDLDLGDDSGDAFAGELDDMMGDDELGDDFAPDDSDSELDSFFEDLSSIEEMDTGDEPDEPDEEVVPQPTPDKPPPPPQPPQPAQEKKPKGKLMIILSLATIILLAGAGAFWFAFLSEKPEEIVQPPQEELFEETGPLVLEEEKPKPKPKPRQVVKRQEPEVIVVPEPVVRPVKPKVQYLIQIATCSFEKCKNDYLEMVRDAGEPAFQRDGGGTFDFIELISRQIFHRREADEIVQRINRKNTHAGKASVVTQTNGYRITMGTFTALDRAKEVKFHLEKIYPPDVLTFNMEHVRKMYETTKVFAGPYDGRKEAKRVLRELRRKKQFRGAFLVRFK